MASEKSRPGAKAKFSYDIDISRAENMIYDGNDEAGVVLLELISAQRKGLLSSDETKRLNEVIREAKAYKMFSRPGAKAKFAVEDRFYFGKERFADTYNQLQDLEAKIHAWIGSQDLPIGAQDTQTISRVAARHMLRGGVSIKQAVKSAALRHAQLGLRAGLALQEWIKENS